MRDRTDRQPLSRAEQLRQKRQQTSRVPVMPAKKTTPEVKRQPVTNPFGRSTAQPSTQPTRQAAVVTTRTYPYSTPLRQSVSAPVRRKVYHVDAQGVETRFPAMPALRFSWQWVSGFIAFALIIFVTMMVYMPAFAVKNIQVTGLQRVPVEEIQNIVLSNSTSIFTLDTDKLKNIIGVKYSELMNIQLSMDLSGTIQFTAVERQPILVWNHPSLTYWFDAEGVRMKPRGDAGAVLNLNSESTIPLINRRPHISSALKYFNLLLERKETPLTPESALLYLDPTVLKAAIDLSAQMPSGALLVYDSISGIGWQDPRGWKVYFGLSLEDIAFKLVEYEAIVERLNALGISPSTISVEHVDSPYYRTE